MSTSRQRELRKQNRLLIRQEGLCERDLAKAIKAMAGRIAASLTPGAAEASLAIVDETRPIIQAILAKRLHQTALIFGERTLDRIGGIVPKSYYPGVEFPREGLNRHLEGKGFREIFEGAIRTWVIRHALARAVTVTGTIKERVRAVILSSAEDSVINTAKRIREVGARLSLTNAARIARTEMHAAANMGSDEAARATGLEMAKEWAAAEDSRTRESHAAADGQTVPMDEPFVIGSAHLMMPGDPNVNAPREVINCRCAALHHPIIGGEVIGGPALSTMPAPAADVPDEAAARSYVLDKGRAEGVEHATAYNLARPDRSYPPTRGTASSCKIHPDVLRDCATKGESVVIHHNHPRSSSFSTADLSFLTQQGLHAIFAHGHDGSQYEARATAHKWKKADGVAAGGASYNELNRLLQDKKITPEEAMATNNHLAWELAKKWGQLDYRATLDGGSKAAWDRVYPLIKHLLKG